MNKRILALDIGDKWIGVAHSDALQIIVSPYQTWQINQFEKELSNYLLKHKVAFILIGLPRTMQGNNSEQTNKVLMWVEEIKIKFKDIIFKLQDERLSSQIAKKILIQNKNKKNSDHTIAACIILENFLLHYNKK